VDVGYSDAVFGAVKVLPETISWDCMSLIGTPGAQQQGFCLDPTGTYLMQQDVPAWIDADETQWSTGGSAANWTHGTDEATGKKFLRQATGGNSVFSATHNFVRTADEGFVIHCKRLAVATIAGVTPLSAQFFVDFSIGRTAGTYGLQLAIEAGKPIRLRGTADNTTYTDLATADELGESETYLNRTNRTLNVGVYSYCDPSWAAGLPGSLALSGPPPGTVVIVINNGDAILTYQTDTLKSGSLKISGQGGQWSCRYAKKRYVASGAITFPPQGRARPLTTVPAARLSGYVPYADSLNIAILPYSATGLNQPVNQAYATATLDATGDVDDTGYARHTVMLSTVLADFPSVQLPPQQFPVFQSYYPIYAEFRQWFDQATMTVRSRALCLFNDNQNVLTPGGGVLPAARAARLWMGYNNLGPGGFAPQITGWTGLDTDGYDWKWQGKQKYFGLVIHDRLRKGDADQTACGYQLPYDGQCHYYAVRQLLYRLGITDDWLNFPRVQRDGATPYYYLPRGTNAEPILQPTPDTPINAFIERIRSLSAAYDPATGQVLPMVLGCDALGNVQYFGLPVGVVNALLNPNGLTLSQLGIAPQNVYSVRPQFNGDGTPALNELLGQHVKAGLLNIRTPVVLEGLDPFRGQAVFGVAYNEALGGGPYANPDAFGYIGTDVPLYISSRLISSQQVAYICAQLAAVQTSFPAVSDELRVHLQPNLFCLDPIAVAEYGTLGNASPVGFYPTMVDKIYDATQPPLVQESTQIAARLLGQAN